MSLRMKKLSQETSVSVVDGFQQQQQKHTMDYQWISYLTLAPGPLRNLHGISILGGRSCKPARESAWILGN
jgi:hypothetical protein